MNRLSSCPKPSYKAVAVILLTAMVFMLLFGFLSPVFALEYEPEQTYANYEKSRTSTSRFIYNYGDDSDNELFVSQFTFAEFYAGDPTVGMGIFSFKDNFYKWDIGWVNSFLPRGLNSYFMSTPVLNNYFVNGISYNIVSAPTITFIFDLNGDFITYRQFLGGYEIGYMHFSLSGKTYNGFVFELIGYTNNIDNVKDYSDFDRIVCYYGPSIDNLDSFEIEVYDTMQYLISFTFPPDVLRVPNPNYNFSLFSRMNCSSYLYCSVPRFSSMHDPSTIDVERTNYSLLLDYVAQSLNFSLMDNLDSSAQYDQGYSDGYNKGSQNSYTNAYNQGLDVGYNEGYQTGYNDGLSVGEGNIDSTISNFVPSILGGVADFIIKVLDFEVFGISVLKVLGTVGVLLILVAFIKMIT